MTDASSLKSCVFLSRQIGFKSSLIKFSSDVYCSWRHNCTVTNTEH